MTRGGKRIAGKGKTLGRPKSKDPRRPLPFRIKATLVDKCRAKGREWLEAIIEAAD